MALTDTKLRALKPSGTRFELPDRDGLVLRVSKRGSMTWAVSLRVSGTGVEVGKRGQRLTGAKRRFTLGSYPVISLSEARSKTLALKQQARQGRHPDGGRLDRRSSPLTVAALVDQYVQEHLRRNLRSADNVERLLRRHVLSAWQHRDIRSLRRSDLGSLLEDVRVPRVTHFQSRRGRRHDLRGGPGAAAEVRKWVRALFQFAMQEDLIETNPFEGARARDKQKGRDRVLSMEELSVIWQSASDAPYPWGPFLQMLILTGARRNEWARAERNWLSSDLSRLEIPSINYKNGRAQAFPLSSQAGAIIRGVPSQDLGPFIFSSTCGLRPISGFSKMKKQLDNLCSFDGTPISHWTLHDLRRSMATHMGRIGIPPHIIEVCLGHTLKGVAAVYRRYEYMAEKAEALQVWADELFASINQVRTMEFVMRGSLVRVRHAAPAIPTVCSQFASDTHLTG